MMKIRGIFKSFILFYLDFCIMIILMIFFFFFFLMFIFLSFSGKKLRLENENTDELLKLFLVLQRQSSGTDKSTAEN